MWSKLFVLWSQANVFFCQLLIVLFLAVIIIWGFFHIVRSIHLFLYQKRMTQAALLPNHVNDDLHLNINTVSAVLREHGVFGIWELVCITAYSAVAWVDNRCEFMTDQGKTAVLRVLQACGINMTSSSFAQSIGAGHGIGSYPFARASSDEAELAELGSKGHLLSDDDDDDGPETDMDVSDGEVPFPTLVSRLSSSRRSPSPLRLPRVVAGSAAVSAHMTLPHAPAAHALAPCILSQELFASLLGLLPPLARASAWRLCFSLAQGASLDLLYRAAGSHAPVVLVLRTDGGAVCGFYSPAPLGGGADAWRGSPKLSLFTLQQQLPHTACPVLSPRVPPAPAPPLPAPPAPTPGWAPRLWTASGRNRFFLRAAPLGLSVGGEGCALHVDAHLGTCRSEPSATFDSPALVDRPSRVLMLEVWALAAP